METYTMTTGYLEKLKAEMEDMLGCGIEIVEDRAPKFWPTTT